MESIKGEGRTITISGIGGFIGSRLAERAISLGFRVQGLDFSPSAVERIIKNLKANCHDENLVGDIFVGNINKVEDASRLVLNANIVIHTAAIVSEDSTMEDCFRVNVLGTSILAEAANKARVDRFIHFSSVMVYGFTFPDQVKEDGPKRGEGNPYCQTKIESESAVMFYHKNATVYERKDGSKSSMKVTIIRPGDVYGPGSVWIDRPLNMMKKGTFAVPGSQGLINHVHVDNLIDAVFLSIDNPRAHGEAFNVTDGVRTSWLEFYQRLATLVKVPQPRSIPKILMYILCFVIYYLHRYVSKSIPYASPNSVLFLSRSNTYSIEKAKSILGYTPNVSLDVGLKQIQNHYVRS